MPHLPRLHSTRKALFASQTAVHLRRTLRSRPAIVVALLSAAILGFWVIHPHEGSQTPPAAVLTQLAGCIPETGHPSKVLAVSGNGAGTYYYLSFTDSRDTPAIEHQILVWRDKYGCVAVSPAMTDPSNDLIGAYLDDQTAHAILSQISLQK